MTRWIRAYPAALALALLIASPAVTLAADGSSGVAGRVLAQDSPLSAARVYAFQIADATLYKVVTGPAGGFEFTQLPVGLYKLIAHKSGYLPVVINLTRPSAAAYQFVEVRLVPEGTTRIDGQEDFWAVRAQIPPDVLREIAITELADAARDTARRDARDVEFRTEMRAMAGFGGVSSLGEGQVRAGGVGLEGHIGRVAIDLDGDFRQFAGSSHGAALASAGEVNTLSLNLESGPSTRVTVSSTSNRLQPQIEELQGSVDFEHYRISLSQAVGQRSRSDLAVQYTSESGFHRHGWIDPQDIPAASESWFLEGGYSSKLGDATRFDTGFRYRERRLVSESDSAILPSSFSQERMELFGRGGTHVQPAVLVEYGLYTTLRDGSLSLAPRGGIVIELGKNWQAETTLSHTVHRDEESLYRTFLPVLFSRAEDCDLAEEFCYQLLFTRSLKGEDEQISFGAIHRRFAETLRLYFSDDFFDRLESLYLVPGDELPEVQLAVSRRLSPHVLARFESNLGLGGGGIFYATDRAAYENSVRYLVTSVDAQFQKTDTGLFVAFHRLLQQPTPIDTGIEDPVALELERLQVLLTQDLNLLLDLTKDWAVRLNMEVSRGSDPFGNPGDDEIRKRILGGVAVRF
jgi:hypothetical protein